MFKNDYQGGGHFDIFSAQGKDPTEFWKLYGGAGIRKVYEKEVKGYVYSLEGTVATTKMQIPSMSLVQRYLVLQIYVPKGGEFSLEIGILDIGNNKRRINMSTSVREVSVTPLHAKLPLTVLYKSTWVNACIDMVSVVNETWTGQTFGKIDSFSISANCKIRRIFTMKHQLHDTTDDHVVYDISDSDDVIYDSIPRQHQFASDVKYYNQVLNVRKIRSAEIKVRGEKQPQIELDLNSSGRRSQVTDSFHIAFGTKIGKPPATGISRKSTSIDLPVYRDSARNSARDSLDPIHNPHSNINTQRHTTEWYERHRQRLSSDPGSFGDSAMNYNLNPLNQSQSWSGAEMQEQKKREAFIKPRPPPRDSSAEPVYRRRPKVKSGDKQHRTPADAHLKSNKNPQGHQHSISAPYTSNKNVAENLKDLDPVKQIVGNSLSPIRGSKLAPLEKKIIQQFPEQLGQKAISKASNDGKHAKESPRSKRFGQLAAVSHSDKSSGQKSHGLNNSRIDVSYEEESVTDVMEALRQKAHDDGTDFTTMKPTSDTNDDIDANELIDSLEKYVANRSRDESSEDDISSEDQGLFQFSSPPKAAIKSDKKINGIGNSNAVNRVKKSIFNTDNTIETNDIGNMYKINDEMEIPYSTIYNPDNYSRPSDTVVKQSSKHIDATEAKTYEYDKLVERLQPRPPSGTKSPSRPGSGKSRLRGGSRGSNNSNKPTPESSGTGDDLQQIKSVNKITLDNTESDNNSQDGRRGKLPLSDYDINAEAVGNYKGNNHHNYYHDHADEIRLRNDQKRIDDLDVIPSPRISQREPRISSAGKRGASANSKRSGSSQGSPALSLKEDSLLPLQIHTHHQSDQMMSPPVSRGSTRLSRKSLREIPESDKRLLKAQYHPGSPTRMMHDTSHYQRLHETFDEQAMLQHLKREQEIGSSLLEDQLGSKARVKQYDHEVAVSEDGDHSSDESFMTTSVPIIGSHNYQDEMHDTLERSDTRDNSMFSPPIVIESQQRLEEQFAISNISISSPQKGFSLSNSSHNHPQENEPADEEEEELDLIYDPVLNCYFDPKTCKYYELV